MAKFRCKRCNYSANTFSNGLPRVCPNCGESKGVEFEKSAADLLSEDE
ncbi:MAG TPA: hypothetical protein VI815_01160 [Candidatus Nanoarchaeia archaeon]|nr:hypothetical protein [Candidatus Nanoarchaeia archaeon]